MKEGGGPLGSLVTVRASLGLLRGNLALTESSPLCPGHSHSLSLFPRLRGGWAPWSKWCPDRVDPRAERDAVTRNQSPAWKLVAKGQ